MNNLTPTNCARLYSNGMSYPNYHFEDIKREYELVNIRLEDIATYFDDITNCELKGEDLKKYLKEIYEKLVEKMKKSRYDDFLISFDDLVNRLKETSDE
jgi:hypothetical protein